MGSLLKNPILGAGQRNASFESLTGSGLDKNRKIILRSICFPTTFFSKNSSFAYFLANSQKKLSEPLYRVSGLFLTLKIVTLCNFIL